MGISRVGMQLITLLASTTCGAGLPPAIGIRDAAPAQASTVDATEDWKRAILQFLAAFSDYLRCAPRSEGVTDAIEGVRECYYTRGIPPDADPAEGRALIEALYGQLKADPGVVDPALRERFEYDLRQMYAELGGNPLNLGS
jgi:hypothetical protein